MSPTIVMQPNGAPRAHIAIGASGGPTIPTAVFQLLVGLIDRNESAHDAMFRPRLHHQLIPNVVLTEPGYPEDLVGELRARGHTVRVQTGHLGDGQRLGVAQYVVQALDAKAPLQAQSDPRKLGKAVVLQ